MSILLIVLPADMFSNILISDTMVNDGLIFLAIRIYMEIYFKKYDFLTWSFKVLTKRLASPSIKLVEE